MTYLSFQEMYMMFDAGLWFTYGRSARLGLESKTTFDAVIAGERVSTTRFRSWPCYKAWSDLPSGSLVRFHDKKDKTGRSLIVRIGEAMPLDLAGCDETTLQVWSLAEGWSIEKGRCFGRNLGTALWIRHDLVQAPAIIAPAQGRLF
jgi:hypothetical protein